MNESYQAYKAAAEKTANILRYEEDLKKTFSIQGAQKVNKMFAIISGHLESVLVGQEVKVTSEEVTLAREVVNLFSGIAAEKPITPIFKDMSQTFLLLVFNWNVATIGDKDIERSVKLVDAIVSSSMTMRETIDLLQKLLEKTKKAHQYEPPSFNLSRAYLENLKKAIEEKSA